MHYIVSSADRMAPIRPKYKHVYDVNLLFRYVKSQGPTLQTGKRNARLRALLCFLLDTLGRQEVLTKCHRGAFELQQPEGNLQTASGFYRVKTWQPGDRDYTPPVVITGFGPGHAHFEVSTPHLMFHYFRQCIPRGITMTVPEYLETIPANESVFRKLDGTGPLQPISVAAEVSRAMKSAGIDSEFAVHSTRAATGTKAYLAGVPIQRILLRGGWKSESTFREWYLKLSREIPKATDPDLSIEAALRQDL